MKLTTDLERKLAAALGGYVGLTFRADASDAFNATMWNLCNSAIGVPMLSHQEITAKRGGASVQTWEGEHE